MAGGQWVADQVDALGASTRSLADIDIGGLGDDELLELTSRLEVVRNALHALSSLVLDEHARRVAAAPQPRSTIGEAAARTGSSRRSLRERAAAGAALRLLPGAEAAARAGRLSPDHLASLAACTRTAPERARRDAALLLSEADVLGADDFRAAARHWQHPAPEAPEAPPTPRRNPAPGTSQAPTGPPPVGGKPG